MVGPQRVEGRHCHIHSDRDEPPSRLGGTAAGHPTKPRAQPRPGFASHRSPQRKEPSEAVWRVHGNGRPRLALAELPCVLSQPGPYHPGPLTPQDDPLHALRQT